MDLDIILAHENAAKLNKDTFERVEKLLAQYRPQLLLVDEYSFNTQDVIKYASQLSELAQQHSCDMVLAADDYRLVPIHGTQDEVLEKERETRPLNFKLWDKLGYDKNQIWKLLPYFTDDSGEIFRKEGKRTWITTRAELQHAGIPFEEISPTRLRQSGEEKAYDDELKSDSIGFYFGKNGTAYAFPKQWQDGPIHRIPETKLIVSICGEINHLNADELSEKTIVLNPSREDDDPFMRARTTLMKGEKFEAATDYLSGCPIDQKTLQNLIRNPSPYLGIRNNEICKSKQIFAVRADSGCNSSGILCLPKNMDLIEYHPERGHSYLKIRI